jgi:adenylate cyclase
MGVSVTRIAEKLDPAPRQYASTVTLVRRSARGAAAAPATCTVADIEHWLLHEAARESEMLLLFESFAWRMVAAGLPIDRASAHIGTLHPQLLGFAWSWLVNDGFCDEIKVAAAAHFSDAYRRSALYRVQEFGETIRRKTGDPAAQVEFPIMKEFADQGLSEYIAMPMSGAGVYHNTLTIATKRDAGFSDTDFATIRRLLDLFALHVERHIALRIADNALNAYLGETAATKVLHGSIKRGAGERMRAIIWASDLRGFTDLSGRLGDVNMIALLNTYFDCLAGAVLRHGGEVLKFMGDGLLAVFPFDGDGGAKRAATAAVAAAQDALAGLDRLNANAPEPLNSFSGWSPLRTGIALHEGDVFFGNIGAPERLDFTVIGSAVNEASRVEGLQKTLGRSLLITQSAARHLDIKLDDLGEQSLRGVEGVMRIFSPAAP